MFPGGRLVKPGSTPNKLDTLSHHHRQTRSKRSCSDQMPRSLRRSPTHKKCGCYS